MSTPVVPLGVTEVLLLLAMMAVAMGLSRLLGLGLLREFAIGTVRSVAQLALVGFVIGWVFLRSEWYWILALLALMSVVAGVTGARRTGMRLRGLSVFLTAVLAGAAAVVLAYLALAVLRIGSWEPRYLVPLGGMLLGNAMTAATLAVERLGSELRQQQGRLEVLLALGASPAQAVHEARRTAIRAAVTPTLNAMMIVGVVTLPGMMTGQMLGGTAPFQAAMYQLMILFGIALCALLSATVTVYALYRRFFTPAEQLDGTVLQGLAR